MTKPAPTLQGEDLSPLSAEEVRPSGKLSALKPTLDFDAALLLQARAIRVAFFDVDGVLTDGGLLISVSGETLKRFNSLDGHGLKMMQQAGITPVVITGRDSLPLRHRLDSLGIKHAYFGIEDKLCCAEKCLLDLQLTWRQAAAMGDDWPDLSVMRRCAVSCAPANAHTEVRAVASYVTHVLGGHGAAREFCDLLLKASGHYADLFDAYTQ